MDLNNEHDRLTWITLIGSPVSFANCSRMCLVGFGVWLKAVLRISSCFALIVVLGPRLFEPLPPSSGLLFSPESRQSGSPSKEPWGSRKCIWAHVLHSINKCDLPDPSHRVPFCCRCLYFVRTSRTGLGVSPSQVHLLKVLGLAVVPGCATPRPLRLLTRSPLKILEGREKEKPKND